MKYSVDKSEKYTILELQEDKLDTIKAPLLKSEFVTLFQAGTTNLILNLTAVKYIDSSGLSSILVANRLAKDLNGQLILVGISDHVMKLVKISKLDGVLNILPTLEEAIDFVFLNEIEKDLNSEEDTASED
ncbi:STAS domain-containing protein [Rapidithrix thailandica]|uniref:Anti-sigma factor antagonist n=1 Tax=Rapidithrix thailandica TaxID=413964 RepID=A0AAW9SI17_9BACT